MRLGVVTTSFPRWPGDPAGSFVAEHVRWLAASGHRVEVIAAGPRGDPEELAVPLPGVRVLRVPAARGLFYSGGAPEALASGSPRRKLDAAAFSMAVAAAVARRASAWDGVIAHWLVPSATAAAVAVRRRPLLAVAHSGDVHLLCRTRAATLSVALLAAAGAEIVFVTGDLRSRLARAVHPRLRAYVEGARVCSMGIDAERFRQAADAAGAPRASFRTVLFLGRLVPVKGVRTAVEAAATWRCGARLVIAGAGPDQAELRALAASLPEARVELVGEVHGAARDRLLASADALVLPSVRVEGQRTEGMPLAALEAMATRVPVIASRVGGLAELPGDAVSWVRPGDAASLARAVDQMAADADARTRQIRSAEAFAESRDWAAVGPVFTIESTVKRSHKARKRMRRTA